MPKNALSEMIGIDLHELHINANRRDGILEFKGRIGAREVEGLYDPLVFHLKYDGRAEDGQYTRADLRGKTHDDMAVPFELLMTWLRGQDVNP